MKSNRYIVGIVTAGRKDPTSVGYEAVDTPCGKILVEEGIIAKTKDKDIFNRISKIFAEFQDKGFVHVSLNMETGETSVV